MMENPVAVMECAPSAEPPIDDIIVLIMNLNNSAEDRIQMLKYLANKVTADPNMSFDSKNENLAKISAAILLINDEKNDANETHTCCGNCQSCSGCGNCGGNCHCGNSHATAKNMIPNVSNALKLNNNSVFNEAPITVHPNQALFFSAMHMVNMYCTFGMPIVVVGIYGHGLFTYTNNIDFDLIKNCAEDPNLDFAYFTDGNRIANLKRDIIR